MTITRSAWVDESSNSQLIMKCTVLATTAETDSWTLKTPKDTIDGTRPWTLYLEFDGTPDAQALPVDLWIGYTDGFIVSGDNPAVAAFGALYKQILDDCVLAVTPLAYSWLMDPNLADADVVTVAAIATGLKIQAPPAPYYAFALNGGSTLAAQTATWRIVQDRAC